MYIGKRMQLTSKNNICFILSTISVCGCREKNMIASVLCIETTDTLGLFIEGSTFRFLVFF